MDINYTCWDIISFLFSWISKTRKNIESIKNISLIKLIFWLFQGMMQFVISYTHMTMLPNTQVGRFHIQSYQRHYSEAGLYWDSNCEYDASASQMLHEQSGDRYYLLLQPWPPPENLILWVRADFKFFF